MKVYKLKLSKNLLEEKHRRLSQIISNLLIYTVHKKVGFTEVFKNLTSIGFKIILLDYKNNYVECSNLLLECQNFLQHYSSCLKFLRNYFNDAIKLFSDLYIYITSAKSFFSCK